MVKFAHLADCHLGSWRSPELEKLNFESFRKSIDIILQEKADFALMAGDLFDSAYPSIDILKETFAEFKRLKENNIPVFLIAGSHDYSASGKTFLDVLEKGGFCKNVLDYEEIDGKIRLAPSKINVGPETISIFGYPGKKSSMEVEDIMRLELPHQDNFSILMLHTTIEDLAPHPEIPKVKKEKLPLANYYALGHIHQRFSTDIGNSRLTYPGPIFPNNFQELSDLQSGSFVMVEISGWDIKSSLIKIPTKEIVIIEEEVTNALIATETLIEKIDRMNLNDKIVLLKLRGRIEQGKTSDIKFDKVEEFIRKKGAYTYLRNISRLKTPEDILELDVVDTEEIESLEKELIKKFSTENPHDFNSQLPSLISALSIEKEEDEKTISFEERLIEELKQIMELKEIL
ncbi:exonuclease SbcCD subunit D [archaeon]|jgi:DNA repair protein SbcD/Mre11|nr:exonuclease SbcCD subunit D [archaeon]